MLIDKLYNLKDNLNYQVSGIKNLDNLIESLNDWTGNPSTFEEYLQQLSNFLNTKLVSQSSIRNAKARKTPNSRESWEAESHTNLYRFMYMNSCENLQELFSEIKKYFS